MKTQQLILDAHLVRPGHSGIECLAVTGAENVLLVVFEGQVCCPACGNALGREDQLMIQVRPRGATYCSLAFIG